MRTTIGVQELKSYSVRGRINYEKDIAALQTSLDGFIEGPNGELDWAMAEDQRRGVA